MMTQKKHGAHLHGGWVGLHGLIFYGEKKWDVKLWWCD